jgi:hypothetical protein
MPLQRRGQLDDQCFLFREMAFALGCVPFCQGEVLKEDFPVH